MPRKRVNLMVSTLAASLAVAGVALLASTPDDPAAVAEVTAPARAAARVPELEVAAAPVRDAVEVSGVVEPIRRVVLTAEVPGRIAALGARAHDAVQAGQMIVQLDDSLLGAALARADGALLRARSADRLAQLELERFRSLETRGVVSAAELDRAANDERAARGALAEAEALRREAAELLARATVRAPFDGVLNDLPHEVGDRLDVGARIGEVLDLAEVEVHVGVSEREIVALRPGDPVTLTVEVHAGQRFPAVIRRVASARDDVTRKFPVEVVAANPARRLLPGMVARVGLQASEERTAIRIPRHATLEEFGVTYVYVLEAGADGPVARRRRIGVRPVAFRPTEVEVVDGLAPGERIAAGNLRSLADGMAVARESRS